LSLVSTGCGISPPPNIKPLQENVASLDPKNWFIYYSADMPSHPARVADAAWSFEFPTGGHVNYVQTPFNTTTVLHNVTISFKIESDAAQYKVMDPGDHLPATLHLFFEQQNDDLSDPNGRWWAGQSRYNLGSEDNSAIKFTIPLTSDQWTNVIGLHDSDAFYAAIANIGWIGITLGGQSFFGHGVAVSSGKARFVLLDFTVE
jgi:hypothetical protein